MSLSMRVTANKVPEPSSNPGGNFPINFRRLAAVSTDMDANARFGVSATRFASICANSSRLLAATPAEERNGYAARAVIAPMSPRAKEANQLCAKSFVAWS